MAMHAVRTGPRDRDAVVLLHSAGLDLTYWDRQIEVLGRDHDVVAVDLPGHGRSPGRPQDMQVAAITTQVRRLLGEMGISRVHVVGLSVGGVIAQRFAVDAPAMVASLILIDTGAHFAPAAQAAMRDRAALLRTTGLSGVLDGLFSHWFRPATLLARPDLVDRATKTLSTLDDHVHAALWEMIAAFDGRDRLRHIVNPTTVIVGEHDSSSPLATASALASDIRRSRLHVVADAAHLSPVEQPAQINELILDALAAHAR